MNTMGWSISEEHHKKWKIGVSRTKPVNFREAIVFAPNLKDKSTYAHEIAHALGLEYTFWSDTSDPAELAKNEEYLNKLKRGIKQNEEAIKSRNNNIEISNSNIKIHQNNIKEYEAYQKTHPNYYKENSQIANYVTEQKNKIEQEQKEIKERTDKIKEIEKNINTQKDNLNVYKSNKYKYKKKSTTNIMDYSSKVNIFTQWQWKIMKSDIKNYYGKLSSNV